MTIEQTKQFIYKSFKSYRELTNSQSIDNLWTEKIPLNIFISLAFDFLITLFIIQK